MRIVWSILLLLISAVSGTASPRDEIAGPVEAQVLRVIDGDTLLVEARPWPQQKVEV
jgi:micrococcal nuclease